MKIKIATVAAVIASIPVSAHADHAGGCHTRRCDWRVGHKRATAKKRATVSPYRAFLAVLRGCEVRGQRHPYRTNTGNGFFGAYQFTVTSWISVGGRGLPHQAARLEQDYRAVRLLHAQGPGAWPVCGRTA